MKLLWPQPMSRNKNMFRVLRCTSQSHRDVPCRTNLQTDSHFSEHSVHRTSLNQFFLRQWIWILSCRILLHWRWDSGTDFFVPQLSCLCRASTMFLRLRHTQLCSTGVHDCYNFILAKLIPQTRLSDTSWEIHTRPHPDKLWKPKTATRWQLTARL